jgi:hypothetical protein
VLETLTTDPPTQNYGATRSYSGSLRERAARQAGTHFDGHRPPLQDSPHKVRRKATTSVFSWSVSFRSSTRLKYSTVSSSVSSLPSCK